MNRLLNRVLPSLLAPPSVTDPPVCSTLTVAWSAEPEAVPSMVTAPPEMSVALTV
jgi:hypothetical protein